MSTYDTVSHRDALSFDEALGVVREVAPRPTSETLPVADAWGRILAEDLTARVDHPQFSASAMDGIAVRAADTPGELALAGESRAGAPFMGALDARQAVRISTGAALPAHADAVVPIEEVIEVDGAVVVTGPVPPARHVRAQAEDLRAGDVLLPAGSRVRAHELAVVLGSGHVELAVRRPLRVAVLATGDELVAPGGRLGPGQVYDLNRSGVAAQAMAAGAVVVDSRHVGDDRGAIETSIAEMLAGDDDGPVDLLITNGGVSVGPHDHLRPALLAAGVEQVFWGIEIRPGGPLWLGRRGEQVVLGLPGNPISAAVCFHLFGRELLGLPEAWSRTAPLAAEFISTTRRTEFIRCRWEANALRPLPRQGSHAITSLAGADALALIPANLERVRAGSPVWFTTLP